MSRMLGALCGSHICFRVRASTCGKRDPKDQDCREPTGKLEHQVRKSNMVTRLIQIVDKPDQVVLPKVFHALCILLPVKCLVKPIGEFG